VDADGEEPEDHEEDDPLPVAGPSRRGNKGRARASLLDEDNQEEGERGGGKWKQGRMAMWMPRKRRRESRQQSR
jgi:hypothetical protein